MEIKNKNEEINKLKIELKNKNVSNPKLVSYDDILIINFTSTDQIIHKSFKCIKNDIFSHLEEKIYNDYPEYRETNNTLLCNGKQILRFKTIAENNINEDSTIILVKPS